MPDPALDALLVLLEARVREEQVGGDEDVGVEVAVEPEAVRGVRRDSRREDRAARRTKDEEAEADCENS